MQRILDISSANDLSLSGRIFVVHGKKSYEASGAKSYVSKILSSSETIFEFDDFSSNPKMEDVKHGVEICDTFGPDTILAIGGGSVLDMAKLIRHYSIAPQIPLITIPTTAGTGAESTQFAVCYINGEKHSICDPAILPNIVILSPGFTYHNGTYLTSCTGFDALAQAIEAYWNINATPESDDLALKAIKLIFTTLPNVKTKQDRKDLLVGANLAGQAINLTRTTVPHALSYTLTSKYGYPHGHAVALTFPFYFDYNVNGRRRDYLGQDYDAYHEKMNRMLSLMDWDRDADLFMWMKCYVFGLGLGYDPAREFVDEVVVKGINLERAKNTPMFINEDIIRKSIKSIRTI